MFHLRKLKRTVPLKLLDITCFKDTDQIEGGTLSLSASAGLPELGWGRKCLSTEQLSAYPSFSYLLVTQEQRTCSVPVLKVISDFQVLRAADPQ
jgi:hypothetical protein